MAALTRFSNKELLMKPDCGGLLENGSCRWLNVSECLGSKCAYCQKISNQDKARERLRSLDEITQEHISRKYYGGYRPWEDHGK